MTEDGDEQADWALIEAFLAEDPLWQRWPGDEGTILDIGDLETRWVLAERDGRFTFETISRGHRKVTASFAAARDARCFLLMRLGESARFRRRLPDIGSTEPAPDTVLDAEPPGHRLSWPAGAAHFASRDDAIVFSWVAGADAAAIAASYRDPNGMPLFDLGLGEATYPVGRRPRGSSLRPQPAEPPPPDPELESDLSVVDPAAADIGWTRGEARGTDVLVVGDGTAGRVIGYERSVFEYRSFVRDWRKTMAKFSTPGAARRFLVMDIGAIRRARRGWPILRAHSVHPETALSKGPAEFAVTWPGGTAAFGLGYQAYQQAMAFSWCAQASLADIRASYGDRNGAPIFDQRADEVPPP